MTQLGEHYNHEGWLHNAVWLYQNGEIYGNSFGQAERAGFGQIDENPYVFLGGFYNE